MGADARQAAQPWQMEDLSREACAALASGDSGDSRLIDGRVIAVKASPVKGDSEHLAVGMAALPPKYSTREHFHEAEEVAVVVSGTGTIFVGGVAYPVQAGSILLVASNAPHVTHNETGEEPLVIFWVYAPGDSAARWLTPPANSE